jgi:NAD(P)H-hydrate epimerase
MRGIDDRAIRGLGIPSLVLMENAGVALVDEVTQRLEGRRLRVTIMCGPGNNGGDGMVAARHLSERGHEVVVFLGVPRASFRGDAKVQLRIISRLGMDISVLSSHSSFERAFCRISESDVVLDALFGTGLDRGLTGNWAECVRLINSCSGLIVAVDVPSGLDADKGRQLGECVSADLTVTLGFPKTGLALFPGAQYAGEVVVADIGIPRAIVEEMDIPGELITQEILGSVYGDRWPDTHKGNYGHLLVCAGSAGKLGAGILAARGAVRSGAGLVTLAVPAPALNVVDASTPEVMAAPLPETDEGTLSLKGINALRRLISERDALAIGPGVSTHPEVAELVRAILEGDGFPAVVDADALNVLGTDLEFLRKRGPSTVLTPHPGEMGRLMGMRTEEIQADRVGSTIECAERSGCTVVLKGAGTVVAQPDGRFFINTTGNPGMATGGTGDVLTGMIGAMLAMGHDTLTSALASVFLHGASGDLASETMTEHALNATDIIDSLGPAISGLLME